VYLVLSEDSTYGKSTEPETSQELSALATVR
jgi:hypothetical protein